MTGSDLTLRDRNSCRLGTDLHLYHMILTCKQVSNRLFATKPRNSHGSSGGGKATDMQKEELIRCVECVTGSLKRLTRER